MTKNNSLLKKCHDPSQDDGDRFVGIKYKDSDIHVYFPLGYKLSDNDNEVRKDIIRLLNILHKFDKKERVIPIKKYDKPQSVFPLNAYLEVIRYYMENGYYIETEPVYKTRDRGKINWPKTIKNQKPTLQKNSKGLYIPVYTDFTVRESNPNDNKEITYINQLCVYESFEKLGWIFTSYMPPKPAGYKETKRNEEEYKENKGKLDNRSQTKRFLIILQKKLSNTNNDKKKILFQSMIDMLKYMEFNSDINNFFFGTETFENIWERLIDKAFGIEDKNKYFPKTEWHLLYGKDHNFKPLEPDTIMIYEDKIYVIDAKYYRYGKTGNPDHLPSTSSINKQITYGEYVKEKKGKDPFNAFLMPYNMHENPFELNGEFATIGEAISKWKSGNNKYEHIQGILVDTRFLMHNYENKKSNIIKLAKSIEDSFQRNKSQPD